MAETEHPMYLRFKEIVDEMYSTFRKKNHDYAGKNPYSSFTDFGWRGVVVRLGDKYQRVKNFSQNGELKITDEKVIDTLQDMAVYAVIAIIMYEKEKKDGV